ncbi:IscS subfamily cysteine desulfurase [Bacillus sp. DTU_2020_1000418_1_SI_GHA_SEK_038]|uniref:IscS subfamily cysteine desulfurase n=1 Tax=Bacillus sp. DTU_2020_1000418_1_SI_GHA_SEK_038 TaxID=3077585 RepID=UPI0028EEBB59|nr:IscS subfamily cysteine desulfurase [Bacillus sp. DTU_2020_1000418_1_SI_GHA_SEK_038]WNS74441.1 IscS subfamily cysteine desulfurase [Bacillus sp. DTU_2020_1000418_1_SI_GHA_SEK_038]
MKYFDYAASCPLDKEAAETFVKAATQYYGNSQSLHDTGSDASSLLENCRSGWANLLQVQKEGIYFTSGGSEGNFLAVHALLTAAKKKGKHIITSMAEHSSIHSTLEKLVNDHHYEVSAVPLDSNGIVDLNQLRSTIREDTVLITIQHGNSEIGTLQPLEEISMLCKKNQILFHSDCVHTFGKTDFSKMALLADSLSISGHKFFGPKGTGAVYINPHLHWMPYYPKTSHERGFRLGTVNVPGIAAMTVAAQKADKNLENNTNHYQQLRKTLLHALEPIQDQYIIYGSDHNQQLPSTIGMSLKGIEGQYVMLECNRMGFAVSTGSACQVGMQTISKTMNAMGIAGKEAKEFIRISFGWNTTEADTEALGKALVRIAQEFLPS